MFLRPVAEPPGEHRHPGDRHRGEDPQRLPPVQSQAGRQADPDERRHPPHEPGRQPDRPLREAALGAREPVVDRPGDVWERPGLPHAKEELQSHQHAEGDQHRLGPRDGIAGEGRQPDKRRPPDHDADEGLAGPVGVAHPAAGDLEQGIGQLEEDQDQVKVPLLPADGRHHVLLGASVHGPVEVGDHRQGAEQSEDGVPDAAGTGGGNRG